MIFTPQIKGKTTKKQVQQEFTAKDLAEYVGGLVAELKQYKKDIVDTFNYKIREVDNKLEEKVKEVVDTTRVLRDTKEEAVKLINEIKIGPPGTPADEERIIKELASLIPDPIDIEKLKKDILSEVPKLDETKLTQRILKEIPENKASLKIIQEKFEVDPMSIIEKIMSLPEEKFKLKLSNIDGLEQTITAFRSQLGRGYLHGGGLSTISHDATLTGLGTPASPLSVVSSGTGDVVGPSSAVSGNIATFDGTTGKLIADSGYALGGNLSETTSTVLVINGGSGAVIGSGVTIQVNQAGISTDGYLSQGDFNIFASKENALTFTSPLDRATDTISLKGLSGFGTAGQVIATNATLDGLEWVNNGSGGALLLDQTTPQTVINGIPIFDLGIQSNADIKIADGGTRAIYIKDQTTLNTNGNELQIIAGKGNGAAHYGGELALFGGQSGSGVDGARLILQGGKIGQVDLIAGQSGVLNITGADNGALAGNNNGGDIVLTGGSPSNLGAYGAVKFLSLSQGSTFASIFDTHLLGADRTYIFPNKSGTFAMTSDITGGALTATYIGYGSGSNLLTGTPTFTFTSSGNILQIGSTSTGEGAKSGEVRIANGVVPYYTGFKSSDSTSASVTYTLPIDKPVSNKILQSDSSGILSWVSQTGGMVYPHAGIAKSTGSAWDTSISGTSSQFVKGDGSLDSSTYLTSLSGAFLLDQTSSQTVINGQPIWNTLTASQLLATDSNKKFQSLDTATYPSLTELAYVKGVTSGIQNQFNGKQNNTNVGTTTTVLHGNAAGTAAFSAVVEADISLSNNTTNNVSTTKHGFTPQLSNNPAQFFNGQGNWVTPSGIVNSYTSQAFTNQTSVTVNHNFGAYPVIQIIDNTGAVIIPLTTVNNSINDFTVTFTNSTTGTIIASVGSPQAAALTVTANDYVILTGDKIIKVTAFGKTITLPTAVGRTGIEFKIDNASTGNITVNTTNSQTINNELTQTLSSDSCMNVYSDGANWRID